MKRNLTLTAILMLFAATVVANCGLRKTTSGNEQTGNAVNGETTAADTATASSATSGDAYEKVDFTLTDISGKQFTLSSLRGRIVVLDFWGSWCGWCIKGMPEMKKAYQKHKGNLEIVGIDCGDKEPVWKAAVSELQLPWIHVYNPRGEGDITRKFGIQGFPTKFVIGKNGEILLSIVGEDPAFYTQLDQIMKENK